MMAAANLPANLPVPSALGSVKELISLCAHTRRLGVSITPSSPYLEHVKAFLEEGPEKFEALLVAIQAQFGVGRINMDVALYIFQTEHIATLAGPFKLFGAEKCLQTSRTIPDLCKSAVPDVLQRVLPAVTLGNDGNGTTFYVFLSDEVVVEFGQPPVIVLGLGGNVISVPDAQLASTVQTAATGCASLVSFLEKLVQQGCGLTLAQLVRLQVELYSIGILHSPCDTREQMLDSKQKVCDVVFDAKPARLEKEVYSLPRYEFLQTLLDV